MIEGGDIGLLLALGAVVLVVVSFCLLWWTMSAWGKVVVELEKTPLAGMVRRPMGSARLQFLFNPPRHGLTEAADRAIARYRKRGAISNVAQIVLVIVAFVILRKVTG